MSDQPQQSPTPPSSPRPLRQALAILLTVTGGIFLASPAKSEAAMVDPNSILNPTPTTSTAKSFKERMQQTRDQLLVVNPNETVEGTRVGWPNWANWRWRNGGWPNWNNWNNWRNWRNWSNWQNF
ncbi:MAG: hypothetical protein ACAI35_02095 [Candidatus Methylacidiphilales bacterium]|nr:hypothetical protein [Candidatus Methylacidiphilales bacterium]